MEKTTKYKFTKSACPLCNEGVAPRQADAVAIFLEDSQSKFSGDKLYCGRHFAKLLPKIGLSFADLKYLNRIILDEVPTIHYVFLYALALSIQKESALIASQSKKRLRRKASKEINIGRPLKVIEIPADKDLPGIQITISIIGRPDSSLRKKLPRCNFVRSEKIMKLAANLKIDLDLTTAIRWAEYLGRIQPPTKHIHYFIPRLPNPSVNVVNFIKQKLVIV